MEMKTKTVMASLAALLLSVSVTNAAQSMGNSLAYVPGQCASTGCNGNLCCGPNGFCGNSSFYCGEGCQNGLCWVPPPPTTGIRIDVPLLVAMVLGVTAGLAFTIVFVICMCGPRNHPWSKHLKGTMFKRFTVSDVRAMTRGFKQSRVFARGAHWVVYRGHLLRSRKPCMVKIHEELTSYAFEKEVKAVATLRHANVAELKGYCIDQRQHVLIYEFDHSSSLQAKLHPSSRRSVLSMRQRLVIAKGVAEAVKHLHANSVIYADIIPPTILVDSITCEPKVADLGFMREVEGSALCLNTTSTLAEYLTKNQGYLDAELGCKGKGGWKIDVFRLGVLLLELLCGRPSFVSDSDRILALACKEAAEADSSHGSSPHSSDKAAKEPVLICGESLNPFKRDATDENEGADEGAEGADVAPAGSEGEGTELLNSVAGFRRLMMECMHLRDWVVIMRGAGKLPQILDPRMIEVDKPALVNDPSSPQAESEKVAIETYVSLALACCGPSESRLTARDVVSNLVRIERLWLGGVEAVALEVNEGGVEGDSGSITSDQSCCCTGTARIPCCTGLSHN